MNKKYGKLIFACILLILGISEMFIMHRYPDLFFPWYRIFSRKYMSLLAYLTSFTLYSVWDVGALCLLILLIICIIYCIRKRKGFLRLFSNTMLAVSLLAFSAFQGWLGNHYAPKLSQEISLEVTEYSADELYEAADYYYRKAAEYAPLIERDTDGHAQVQDLRELAVTAGRSYLPLADDYPVFAGSSVPVKRFTLIGEYLLYNGIIGMFMPVTGESSVPANVPPVPMAYTMCHEAAHRLGIASEQEANFCAFLACAYSTDARLLYSGYYSAFGYCFSSLYQADPERAAELYHKYDEEIGYLLIQQDRRDTNEAYKKYESPLKEISDNINDTYLKTFSQESGIRSYGEVTDYLIAWYISIREN